MSTTPESVGRGGEIASDDVWAGVVILPPHACWDGTAYRGPMLQRLDDSRLAAESSGARCFRMGDFVGVVAPGRAQALQAARLLRLTWTGVGDSPADTPPDTAPAPTPGPAPDPDGALARIASTDTPGLQRDYRWPALAAGIDPVGEAWAECVWIGETLSVRTNTDDPPGCIRALAELFGIGPGLVRVASNGLPPSPHALDLAGDAAVLARASERCIRVERPAREDGGPAPYIDVAAVGFASRDGGLRSLQLAGSQTAADRPPLARLLTAGRQAAPSHLVEPLSYRFVVASAATVLQPLQMRPASPGAGAAAFAFARESAIDEWAALHRQDPVALRLDGAHDPAGASLIREVAQRAGWQTRSAQSMPAGTGRGFAFASALDTSVKPPRPSWAAWVVDVAVDPATGGVDVTRLVVGHQLGELQLARDAGESAQSQLADACRNLLGAPVAFDAGAVHPDPAATVPPAELVGVTPPNPLAPRGSAVSADAQRPAELSLGPALTLPAAAALANAIFDATGVRLRQPPFGGLVLQKEMQALAGVAPASRRRIGGWLAGAATLVAGLVVSALPWRGAIAPLTSPVDSSLYSAAAIERGRLVAAAGDCMVCHTAPGGATNAGGLGLETPFGTVYSTNITSDAATGIGAWSYAAFERAMRQGIHRDGRHLYPAFPYTAFAKLSDGDVQALYAYLMAQPAVVSKVPATRLAFPFSVRPLLAGWNMLFHDPNPYRPDPSRTVEWNRGAYLVQGAGHCGACHTPRNALGAEKSGPAAFLAGGEAEGWMAPALNGSSRSPRPWSEADFYQYLRKGYAPAHGVAAGPMGPVVESLAALPDSDIQAMAVYLKSLAPVTASATVAPVPAPVPSPQSTRLLPEAGQKLFLGACAACHDQAAGPALFGARPELSLNTNIHADTPDNLIQVVLHGIDTPAYDALGAMPGFADVLDDAQIADLLRYMRARFAPERPAWTGETERVRTLRSAHQERRLAD